jgi:parvulin-like peptidyl-prolyl isomerase
MADFIGNFQRETGLGEEYFRARLGEEIHRRRMQERLAQAVEPMAEQVHARHILVETEEEAEGVLARLQAGEDFASLAQELSLDTPSAEQGGDLGWFPRGLMTFAFEEAAFSMEVGQLSGTVQTTFGYHILQVLGREERALEGASLAALKEGAFYEWLQGEREVAEIERFPLPRLPTPRPGL